MKAGSKYLFKNLGFLTLGQFGTKILNFFLIPLYTNVLSTAEYGTFDFYNTTILLVVPLITGNIADAALRFPLDEDADLNKICKIVLKYCFFGTFLFVLFSLINNVFGIIPALKEYTLFLILMFIVRTFDSALINLGRGLDCIKHIAISGVICTAVMIGLNLLFLLSLDMGLTGYFLANIIGMAVQSLYLLVTTKILKYLRKGARDKALEKQMLAYSRPLLVNNISWWVTSMSDRYIVIWFCDMAANGIYSVGYKIPSILNIFQIAFNQAWTLSAVKDYDQEDKSGFFINLYNYYNFAMLCTCSLLIICSKFLATILYAKDFYMAWQFVPFLLVATFFGSLSGYIAGIFAAVKESKVVAKTTVCGAICNIVMNIILVPAIGPLGAAIATMISYALIWALGLYNVKKYIRLKISLFRDILSYVILLAQSVLLFYTEQTGQAYVAEIVLFIVIIILYWKQVRGLLQKIRSRMNK